MSVLGCKCGFTLSDRKLDTREREREREKGKVQKNSRIPIEGGRERVRERVVTLV